MKEFGFCKAVRTRILRTGYMLITYEAINQIETVGGMGYATTFSMDILVREKGYLKIR